MVCFGLVFSAGIPCIAAVGIQCPSNFNHETKTVFDTTSMCYGFLGVFKAGKVFFNPVAISVLTVLPRYLS